MHYSWRSENAGLFFSIFDYSISRRDLLSKLICAKEKYKRGI